MVFVCYHIILKSLLKNKNILKIDFSSFIDFVLSLHLPCTLILLMSIVEPIFFLERRAFAL